MADREKIEELIKKLEEESEKYALDDLDDEDLYYTGYSSGLRYAAERLRELFERQQGNVIIENAKHIVNIGRVEVFNG